MAGPAAERSPPAAADDQDTDWSDRVRRQWRRCVLLVAHWRLRAVVGWRLLVHTLRRVYRRSFRRDHREVARTRVDGSAGTNLPTVAGIRPLPAPTDPEESVPDESPTARSLPATGEPRRELPANDGVLDVERTPDRLIMSDPTTEEAYLASTVWVDVEE